MLLLKRMRQRASVFVALLIVTAIGSGLLVGITGVLDAAEAAGVRAALSQRSGADVVLELSLRSDPDGEAQDARVDALLARVFADEDRVLGVDVTRAIVSDSPVSLSTGVKAFVASVPDLESTAQLVAGEWPRTDAEASVQADAAAGLGLEPGDELVVGETRVVITGTWRVTDPVDPRWVSDPLFLDGHSGVVLGPIVLAESALPAVAAITDTRWAIVPTVATLRAGDLEIFIEGWDEIADSLRADGGFNVNSLHRGGRLASIATDIQTNVNGLRAVAPVALLIIAALTILTIVELARLLATMRAPEYLLFWSRGDTVLALTLGAAVEAAAASLVGAALGTLLAQDITLWPVSGAVVLAAAALFGARTFETARSVARAGGSAADGRSNRITGAAGPVLLTVAAVVSTWQLLLYGSPLSPTKDGGTQVDPIAVLAPALCLLALVTIAVAVLPLAGRLLDRVAGRSSGHALVLRVLARRSQLFAAAFVLSALAAGQLTIAAAYSQTWESSYSTTAALRAGSDLAIEDFHAPLTEEVLTGVAGVDGVGAVASVYSEPVTVGATSASMLAVTPAALAELGTTAGGFFDREAAAAQIALPVTGPRIPHGTREVSVTASSDGAVPVELTLVVADELGVQREVAATGSYKFALPEGRGDWNVLGFDVRMPEGGTSAFLVTGMTANGEAVDIGGGWAAAGFDPLQAAVTVDPTGVGFMDAVGLTSVRLTPLYGNLTDDVRPPVLISRELARSARIRVGDTVPVAIDPRVAPFASEVVGIVAAVPGAEAEPAVLLDASLVEAVRARLYEKTQTPGAAWIGASDALPGIEEAVPAGVLVSAASVDANRGILGSAARALWLGALGAGVLGLIAVMASIAVQLRTRQDETSLLRALGISDRRIAAARMAELGIVIALGLLIGVGIGLATTALTISPLARAAVPGSYEAIATVPALDPAGLAGGLGSLVVGFTLCLLYCGRRVTR